MYLTLFFVIGGLAFLAIFFHYVPFFLWLSAKVSGVNISLVQLFLMRIRNVPPYIIVPGLIEAHKAGLSNITRDELEAHYLAGGHVEKVVHALVSASKANIELPFQMATAIDLAGRDVFEAVQMSVNPKVIDTPPVTAVAKDGIQLIAKARVTVRANIRQLVGGAGEDTVPAENQFCQKRYGGRSGKFYSRQAQLSPQRRQMQQHCPACGVGFKHQTQHPRKRRKDGRVEKIHRQVSFLHRKIRQRPAR